MVDHAKLQAALTAFVNDLKDEGHEIDAIAEALFSHAEVVKASAVETDEREIPNPASASSAEPAATTSSPAGSTGTTETENPAPAVA